VPLGVLRVPWRIGLRSSTARSRRSRIPVLEMLVAHKAALQYGHDVFDNALPNLVSIPADARQHGPSLWDPNLTAGNGRAWSPRPADGPRRRGWVCSRPEAHLGLETGGAILCHALGRPVRGCRAHRGPLIELVGHELNVSLAVPARWVTPLAESSEGVCALACW
jgi:hypothetical protein